MMIRLNSKYTIVLLLTLTFQIENIVATIACDKYNITHSIQNDAITINFSSNNLLKLNRTVQCTSNSSKEIINGCTHQCIGLEYGRDDEIFIDMQHANGSIDTCWIKYIIDLQKPTLAFLDVPGDRIRLGVNRPLGSFDYVDVYCSDAEPYAIFNTSTSLNNSIIIVDCPFTSNLPLMSFLLETVKKDFPSVGNHIIQEVPLPVPFNFSLDTLLLKVTAYVPPTMNLPSTYEFHLSFYDKNNTYERAKVVNLNPASGINLTYGLVPNFEHRIDFLHIVNSTIYARSNAILLPISNISYPFEVTNLRVYEESHNIIVNWNDPHSIHDPIEFIVQCNSNINSRRNVERNTTYVCEYMTFNETDIISIETRVTTPNYRHDQIIVKMNVPQIPQIPEFEVVNKTETSITIRWKYNNQSLLTNSFDYKIKCGLNGSATQIDIQSNEYQCQSLEEGTLYVITILLVNINNTIQRTKSILANTLLQKCQYRNHFYVPDLNSTRSIIIEWSPPNKSFDKIYVQCPDTYISFEYYQVMSFMYVKCTVTSGLPFNVTFSTSKNGFEWAVFQFTHTPPIESTTTSTLAARTTTTTSLPLTTTSTATRTMTTTTTSTSTTAISNVNSSSVTTATIPNSATIPSVSSDCSPDILLKTEINLTKWRTAAIIAFIITGFLAVSTICLIAFCVILCLRNRYNISDE